MDRRDFLKLIGVVGFAPFSLVKDGQIKKSGGLALFKIKSDCVLNPNCNYRIAMVDGKGREIWAPRTLGYRYGDDSIRYKAADIPIDKDYFFVAAKLVNPRGYLVGEQRLAYPFPAHAGDIVKLTYSLNYHFG